MTPRPPEALTTEQARAFRLAAKHLRDGKAGSDDALRALVHVGCSVSQAERIIDVMLAQARS